VPGMGSGHGAAAVVPWVPPTHQRLPWHTPLGPWQHPPHSSSENLTLHRGAMDGGAWPAATTGTSAETRLKQ
jgi:hypothetical protein